MDHKLKQLTKRCINLKIAIDRLERENWRLKEQLDDLYERYGAMQTLIDNQQKIARIVRKKNKIDYLELIEDVIYTDEGIVVVIN